MLIDRLVLHFVSEQFYFFAVLDFVHENFGRLETGHIMFVYDNGRIARNVARNFLLTLLINETAEAAHIYIVPAGHVGFYDIKKCFYTCRYIGFVDTGLFCDLIDNVCFGHIKNVRKGRKVNRQSFKRKKNLLIIT